MFTVSEIKPLPQNPHDPRNAPSQGRPPRAHRDTLAEMNKSVFTARRQAAHERVVDILQRKMIISSKTKRARLYGLCLDLLDETLSASRRSQVQQETPVTHYLDMLRETVGACLAVLKHEMTLLQEAEEFTQLQDETSVRSISTSNDVFSDSEMNLLDCVDGQLRFGAPILAEDTNRRKAEFTEDEHRRYNLARAEYREYYRTFSGFNGENHSDDDQG